MTEKLRVVNSGALTDRQEVTARMEEALKRIKSGDLKPNRLFLMLVDDDLEEFRMTVIYHGRAIQMVGLIEAAKAGLLDEIREG